jgi:hypothetical protein
MPDFVPRFAREPWHEMSGMNVGGLSLWQRLRAETGQVWEDGTFKEDGGATKPVLFDADITVHQIVTDLSAMKVWLKIPQKTSWREVDPKNLFTG